MFEEYIEEYLRNPSITDIKEICPKIWKINYGKLKAIDFIGTLVRFSSYITAIGRIRLSEAVRKVGEENIYYMDTDSIVS